MQSVDLQRLIQIIVEEVAAESSGDLRAQAQQLLGQLR